MPIKRNEGWREPLLSITARLGLTFLIGFVLLVLSVFPIPTGHFGDVRPGFILMAVYYWSIMWPTVMTYLTTFLIGIAFDLLAGLPPGMNAMTLLMVQWVTRSQRKFMLGQSFRVIWAGLALMAFLSAFIHWVIFSLLHGTLLGAQSVVVGAVLTCLLFPVMMLPLSAFGRWIADKSSRLA
ncbi:MAG TPA: rod shape-determining protein MreD [Alphaproteobacteria bacterium]|jgi:rod shape-determining protein MreD|nr:rod shape-determining protein MreD [Alphaproteobacteria bacterium]